MISAITCTMHDRFMENVFNNYARQTLLDKELVVILNNNRINIRKWQEHAKAYQHVRIFRLDESATLGDCLNYAVERAQYGIMAKMDDDDYYGRDYLKEAKELFDTKLDIGVLGKNCYYVYLEGIRKLVLMNDIENDYTDNVAGATLTFKKVVWEEINFEKVNRAEDYFFQKAVLEKGLKIYSSDRYNYMYMRRSDAHHAWKVDYDFFLQWGKQVDCPINFLDIVER